MFYGNKWSRVRVWRAVVGCTVKAASGQPLLTSCYWSSLEGGEGVSLRGWCSWPREEPGSRLRAGVGL